MKAEIITIGDELLIGQTIDTNSAWIGAELSLAGFDIQRKTSVHDNRTISWMHYRMPKENQM